MMRRILAELRDLALLGAMFAVACVGVVGIAHAFEAIVRWTL